MNRLTPIIAVVLVLSLAGINGAFSQESSGVTPRNPFVRPKKPALTPERAEQQPEPPAAGQTSVVQQNMVSTSRKALVASFSLRATVVAGAHSLANIDGEILAVGQQKDGFRLVAVRDGAAVFSKEGQTVTLTVTGNRNTTGQLP